MLVAGIASDEHAPLLVLAGSQDAEVPEADVVERGLKAEAGRLVQQAKEIEVVLPRVFRYRRMEEEALFSVDPSEELPVPLQLRLEHAVGRRARVPVEALVQLARPKDRQHHALVEVASAAV